MEKVMTIVGYVVLAVMLAGLGYVGGRHSAKVVCANSALTTTDTVWTEIHDTCWRVESAEVMRTDTVRLAQVVCAENAPTTRDTLILHDSVFVEIPIERKTFTGENWRVTIERKTFTGENWRVTAHGYRVGLDEVWVNRPTVYVTKTNTKTKRWAFSVGAQIGYGYTIHGGSPYIGLGVGFGYTF